MRELMVMVNKNQPGSAAKLAWALMMFADAGAPPGHLILGKDALEFYRQKQTVREKENQGWHDLIAHTDHET